MTDKVYKKIEIAGTSPESYEAAIRNAVEQARKTVRGLSWFEVTEMRGNLEGPDIVYQVSLKVGFRLMEE